MNVSLKHIRQVTLNLLMFCIIHQDVDLFFKSYKKLPGNFPVACMAADQQSPLIHLTKVFLSFKIKRELMLKTCKQCKFIDQDLAKNIIIPVNADEGFQLTVVHPLMKVPVNCPEGFA